MPYTIKARYYAGPDQTSETYVITSDNADKDTRHEVGKKLMIIPMETVEEANADAKKEAIPAVLKVLDENSQKPPEPKQDKPAKAVVDLTNNVEIGDAARLAASFVMPSDCNECPISRGCPFVYQCDECRQDLRNYYSRPSQDKDSKP